MIKIKGIYIGEGKIELETMKIIEDLSDEKPLGMLSGSKIELTFSFDENQFLLGKNGIVWGTYDLRQAEIIQNALFAQHIISDVKNMSFNQTEMFLLKILNETDISDAIDFIWQNSDGLRLKPDWAYSDGENNKSFEQWLSGQ